MENLEETTTKAEEEESTQTEETKPTETEKEPTASEKKYDQKELDTAVGKGTKTFQSQLSVSKAAEAAERLNWGLFNPYKKRHRGR